MKSVSAGSEEVESREYRKWSERDIMDRKERVEWKTN